MAIYIPNKIPWWPSPPDVASVFRTNAEASCLGHICQLNLGTQDKWTERPLGPKSDGASQN